MSEKSEQIKRQKAEELLKLYSVVKKDEQKLEVLKGEMIPLLTMGEVVESSTGKVSLTETTLRKVDYDRMNELFKGNKITPEERAAYFQESSTLTPKGKKALEEKEWMGGCVTLSKSPRLSIKPVA
ncbi:MAG: hypothetical protein IEMM0008_1797 [bacterium]|nr:MAG: hypothetical protein IEMM0008_1797 [bacterium]